MMDKRLYKKLIKVAENKGRIYYQELAYGLGEPYDDVNERNQFHDKLGIITRFEHDNGRPMLSVLVVLKEGHMSNKMKMPGAGFFGLAKKLGVWDGKNMEKFFVLEVNKVHDCWNKKV